MSDIVLTRFTGPLPRRAWPLIALLLALLLMAFFTITDPAHLAHDPALAGADYVGYAVCHRITVRSFTVAGRQLPLCARCTGMYLGVALVFAVFYLGGRGRRSNLPPLKIMLMLLGFIGLMGIDGINSYSHFFPNAPHLYTPQNWLRLVTGMGAGLAMGIILFPALAQTLWRQQEFQPVLGNYRELAGLVLLASLAILMVLSNQPAILYVLGLVSAFGVLIVLASVNTTLMLIIIKRDATASSWRQVLIPMATGLALAILQVAVVSYARFAFTGTMTGLPGLA